MRRFFAAALAACITLLAAVPASAGLYAALGRFDAIGDDPNVEWTRQPGYKAGGTFSSTGDSLVNFYFLPPGGPIHSYPAEVEGLHELAALGAITARMEITSHLAGIGENSPNGRPFAYTTISFSYAGDTPIEFGGSTYGMGANLLTAAEIPLNARGGQWSVAYYSSDFLDLSRFAWVPSGGNLTLDDPPPLVVRDGAAAVDDYVGRFSSGTFYGGVPEPGTWALLIVGFGLAGAALRNRSARLARILNPNTTSDRLQQPHVGTASAPGA